MNSIFSKTEEKLLAEGFTFERKDFNRPWGGFFVIEENQAQQFAQKYFPNLPKDTLKEGQKVSPKILLVAPNKRLSWQYHFRRSEIWRVVNGKVGIIKSATDEETPMQHYKIGDRISLDQGERHRLIGLEDWGMVAEIWMHSDPNHPSDENDIVRLQDDFNRKSPTTNKNLNMDFNKKLNRLFERHKTLIQLKNERQVDGNGIYDRWKNPILTAAHIPIFWRYDLNKKTNPFLMERQGINAAFNAGAMLWKGKYILAVRVEGNDRKSFFAIAESPNGVDNFQFWDYPITMPETANPDTNVYDMRLVEHEDGWIYGLFCTERKDKTQPNNMSAAEAQCGIARTKDLVNWERLPDLITHSGQQRNVVLHPEFINGKYALYTRPQDGFISVGGGGGIGWGYTESMERAEVKEEIIIDNKAYHTIKEIKNGQGPTPIKTSEGWLHLAHGVRNTAAGLRYVLYMFMTALDEPWKIIYAPAGHFIAPQGAERIGDVSNVAFSNGWIVNEKEEVFIYYASSDTRMHVATSTLPQLIDYVKHTPTDGFRSAASVATRNVLIARNLKFY